jgi:hypothetical protein
VVESVTCTGFKVTWTVSFCAFSGIFLPSLDPYETVAESDRVGKYVVISNLASAS